MSRYIKILSMGPTMEEVSNESRSVVEESPKRSALNWVIRALFYPFTHHLSLWRTLRFNFRYFPVIVAVKLPVFLFRGVRLKQMKGNVLFGFPNLKPGCVRIGGESYGFQTRYHQTIWEQLGGTVIFGKDTRIGKGTLISVGLNGKLRLGNHVNLGGNDRVVCKKSITIGDHTMVAWDVQIIDTDFHPTVNTIFKTTNCAEKPIVIGSHNWLGFGSAILKGTVTPNNCIVAANTTINHDYGEMGENILLGHEPSVKVTAKYISFDHRLAEDLTEMFIQSPEWEEFDRLIQLRNKRKAM
jgi:acetyltransferase-like isoleucine patch superfamily enzyme